MHSCWATLTAHAAKLGSSLLLQPCEVLELTFQYGSRLDKCFCPLQFGLGRSVFLPWLSCVTTGKALPALGLYFPFYLSHLLRL